jgi:hypothetical protein
MALSDGGWSSGGFIADSKIDGKMDCGTQQQFLTRNTDLTDWKDEKRSWNMVFVGDEHAPAGRWPAPPNTVIGRTPVVREKPFLFIEKNGNYYVMLPGLKTDSQGPSWVSKEAPGVSIPLDRFYLAKADRDTAKTMNAALKRGKHLLLTPGVYHLSEALHVSRPDTVVMGLGIATLIPDKGTPAIVVDDVDGVTLAGLLLQAGPIRSTALLRVGKNGSHKDHSKDPTVLFDVHATVGGSDPGTTRSCFILDSDNVIVDNCWLWRCDDGAGVGWDLNRCETGLIVNGNDVTAYGLFVEHCQKYQTLWNGNGGRVYFYQSEMPYDPPTQTAWRHGAVEGYASYKVADTVLTHEAQGLGVYCVFGKDVFSENAFEAPVRPGVSLQHLVTLRFGGAKNSGMRHVLNGNGHAVDSATKSARMN